METPGAGKTCFFRFRGWTTEQREGVSYDVPVMLISPCCIQPFSGHLQQFSGSWLLSNGIPACLRTSSRRISGVCVPVVNGWHHPALLLQQSERTPLNDNHINMPLRHHPENCHHWRDRGRIFPFSWTISAPVPADTDTTASYPQF